MARRPPPGAPSLGRAAATRNLRPALLAVCEGATEERCLGNLRARWRVPSLRVQVVCARGDPSEVVRKARTLWEDSGRKHHRPEVWVAFDRDEHHHWAAALDQARALGFRLAVSNPCFELWGLLLHRDQTAPIDRDEAQRALAEVHPGYDHTRSPYLDLETTVAGMDEAHGRAENLRRRAEETGDPNGNPTTSFDRLVQRIREIAVAT